MDSAHRGACDTHHSIDILEPVLRHRTCDEGPKDSESEAQLPTGAGIEEIPSQHGNAYKEPVSRPLFREAAHHLAGARIAPAVFVRLQVEMAVGHHSHEVLIMLPVLIELHVTGVRGAEYMALG